MPDVAEKMSLLENAMMKLAYSQMNTEVEIRKLSQEMSEFKDEMKDFKDEMSDFKNEMTDFKDEMSSFKRESEADRKRMNKQWGDLANKMGTIVEDIVVPNIAGVALKYFHCSDVDDLMVRRFKRSRTDKSKKREFDVIAVCDDKVIFNETKATPRISYIDSFSEFIDSGEFFEYFPEYKEKEIIPVFSSLYIRDDIVDYITKKGIYAMAMRDDTMDILNAADVSKDL